MKIAGPVSVAAAVFFALGFVGSPASAAPQGPWVKPAADLSATGESARRPQITTGPDGTTTAIWYRSNGSNDIIQTSTRPPGGSFGAPVSHSLNGQDADKPQITTAPDGTTTAVWQRFDSSRDVVQAVTRPLGGLFGAPVDLSAADLSAVDAQITTAPDGTTTVVWMRGNGASYIIQAVTRAPGGFFGAPSDVSADSGYSYSPQITTSPDGTATVVWRRATGASYIIRAATRPPGGSFGAPVDLSAGGEAASGPQINAAPDGTFTAVWSRFNGYNDIIQTKTRPPGGSFGAIIRLSTPGQDARDPQITTAFDGTTTAVWRRYNSSNYVIQAATRPPGGSFGTPVDLSPMDENAHEPQITTAPDGTATAVWRLYNGSNEIIQAATRPPGGSFSTPVDLSATDQSGSGPQITTAPDGTATSVWQSFKVSEYIIQAISTAQPTFTLDAALIGSGVGRVASAPSGIDCGSDCSESYLSYTPVTLTATPDPGNTFQGWGGDCEGSAGNSCELTMLDDREVTAGFAAPPPPPQAGEAKLKITKVKPGKPKAKRGKKVKIKVIGKNVGDAKAKKAKLCLKIKKGVRKKLKPKGKKCKKLGSLAPGQAKKKPFKLKATRKAKKGKKYKVKAKLSAANAKTVTRAVKVKVK